jgi:hypothetical protein
MTDKDFIESCEQLAKEKPMCWLNDVNLRRLCALARQALSEPDTDAVEVKLAVCFDKGNNDLRAYGCGDYENPKEALLEMRALHQLTPTHEGIVTARLPRVRVPEVEGRLES